MLIIHSVFSVHVNNEIRMTTQHRHRFASSQSTIRFGFIIPDTRMTKNSELYSDNDGPHECVLKKVTIIISIHRILNINVRFCVFQMDAQNKMMTVRMQLLRSDDPSQFVVYTERLDFVNPSYVILDIHLSLPFSDQPVPSPRNRSMGILNNVKQDLLLCESSNKSEERHWLRLSFRFHELTGNHWSLRDKFVTVPGNYCYDESNDLNSSVS